MHDLDQRPVQGGHKKGRPRSSEKQAEDQQRGHAHRFQDVVPQKPAFGLGQITETDDEFGQTFHAGSYLVRRMIFDRMYPAPKAMSTLPSGFCRTRSLTSSTPALPAS